MGKLRKMLGRVDSQECVGLMRLIETQSKETISNWAISYAKENYLPIFEAHCPGISSLQEGIAICETYLAGRMKLAELKPILKATRELAAKIENPTGQAAARAISTACATVQTPSNGLGYLFYGAAAVAYNEAGWEESPPVYEALATKELERALEALKKVAVENEENPVKISWNC